MLSQYLVRRCPCNEADGSNLERLVMTPCSEASIDSELHNLREVRANLSECLDVLPGDDVAHFKLAMALSFVQMAIEALSSFQAERAASARWLGGT